MSIATCVNGSPIHEVKCKKMLSHGAKENADKKPKPRIKLCSLAIN
jgi:hypothetical protein